MRVYLACGILIIHRKNIKSDLIRKGETKSFEYMELFFPNGSLSTRFIVIYRPPYSENHPVTSSMFFTEFAEYLETTLAVPDQLLFTGDFNFHMDNKDDVDTIKFGDLLTSSGLQQHVHGVTH